MPTVIGREVGPIGYGLMGFTWRPEPTPLDQAIDALKTAVENGMTLWNGGEFYGTPEWNSMTLLRHYFTKYPEDADKVTLIIKGGADLKTHRLDGSPEGIRRSLDNIINQLGGTKKLDLFSCTRRDHNTPLEVTFGVIQKEYIDTGKLGAIALSEVNAQTIHEAAKLAKVGTVEVELSMFSPDILTNGVAAACAEHDIPITAYSPIGRGMLSGRFKDVSEVQSFGFIATFPRFQKEAFEHNLKLVNHVEALAKEKGCTPAQLAIAWVHSQGKRPGRPTIIPIPGATTAERVRENSQLIELTEDEVKKIDTIVESFEVAGARYPPSVPTNT
ncbi:Aldo/keto reductase [Trichoderma aethiopicum]